MDERLNLIGRTSTEITELVTPLTDRAFRGRQVAHWVNQRLVLDFDAMSDLPRELRLRLAARFRLAEPAVERESGAADGTTKLLFRLDDGAMVEGVLMPEARKTTFCVSSQTGCAVNCSFCVTGVLGAGRNLEAADIVGHFRAMLRRRPDCDRVNIVFMGMGEPLLNTRNLGRALEVLFETISPRRVTVSTAGILPGIEWLAALPRRPKLAVSLNAPDQATRERIMPITRAYPLPELMATLRRFPLERGRRITFEYVLIAGLNDLPEHALAVANLVRGIPCKLNLIPLNRDPVHLGSMAPPTEEAVDRFARVLRDLGRTVTVRRSRGSDMAAACGQLKGGRG